MNKENVWEGIDRDRIRFFSYNKQNFVMDKGSCNLIEGSSSIHPAVNLAYLMGCDPIILSGCDCKYVGNDYHYCDMELEYKGRSHTFADYPSRIPREGDTDSILKGHVSCWEKVRNQNPDINIIDTSGGKLTMFPQMTIEEVMNKYSKRKLKGEK